MYPQRKQPQARALGAPRLAGRYEPEAVAVMDAPEPQPPVEIVPADALYQAMLKQFKPVEVARSAALPTSELAERARYRDEINRGYNVDTYRKEINLALRKSCFKRGFLPSRDEDLRQIIDVAIWEATLKYRDGMNPALAYKIAENQANRFLNKQYEEQTIVVTTSVLESGKPTGKNIPEFGKPERIPRWESFDEKLTDEEGQEYSRIENEIVMAAQPPPTAPTLDKFISDFAKINRFPLLRALVDGWKPGSAKRIIGELFLAMPDTTVREFPGVSKSNAARVLKVVKAEFRAALQGEVGQES